MKTALIKQPAGIGDIFFCQKIAHHYREKGYEIVWPVCNTYEYIKDYIEDISFVRETDDFPYKKIYIDPKNKSIIEKDNFIFIPLHGHHYNYDISVMESKYRLVGLDFHDWANYFNFKRNEIRENNLFYNILNLNDGEEYNLINKNYGTPPNYLVYNKVNVPQNGLKNIEVRFIENSTVFDWCKVIEKASNMYLIETCFNYFIERLPLNAKDLHLFLRNKVTYFNIKNIYKVPWNFILKE